MIVLRALSFHGKPCPDVGPATFDELGGSIGRADDNHLVLPDAQRIVSRRHAAVLYRGGGFVIADQGGNPVKVNGRPLGSGHEAPLAPGDRVQVGGYLLAVEAAGAGGGSPGARPPPAGIPDDWDPFAPAAPAGAQPRPPAAAPEAATLVPGLPVGSARQEASLDALFGIRSGAGGGDPLADSPLAEPIATPNMAARRDPVLSLGAVTPGSAPTRRDDVSDLNSAFAPPRAEAPAGAVLSWDKPDHERRTVVRRAVRSPRPAQPAADGDLLAAFLQGVATPGIAPDGLTPEFMRLLGCLLREATHGTVDLLLARATLKREVRAEVTTISTQENNPLKFSPGVEAALQHLLSPPVRGFMAPADAMRDAYDDLRAHQFGLIAGVRAALDGMLARFDPALLDTAAASGIDRLLPARRKAALWDDFVARHAALCREAEDDFHHLFGDAFRAAYQEHTARLAKERP